MRCALRLRRISCPHFLEQQTSLCPPRFTLLRYSDCGIEWPFPQMGQTSATRLARFIPAALPAARGGVRHIEEDIGLSHKTRVPMGNLLMLIYSDNFQYQRKDNRR